MHLETKAMLRQECENNVLTTMLPKHILARINAGEADIGNAHEKVTVLFSGASPLRDTHKAKSALLPPLRKRSHHHIFRPPSAPERPPLAAFRVPSPVP